MIRPVHGSSSGYATRRSDWAADETLLPWLPGHTPLHLLVGWFIQAGSRSPRQQIGFLVPICSRRRREARWIQEEQGSEVTPLVHRKQLFILKYSHPQLQFDLLGLTGTDRQRLHQGQEMILKSVECFYFQPLWLQAVCSFSPPVWISFYHLSLILSWIQVWPLTRPFQPI